MIHCAAVIGLKSTIWYLGPHQVVKKVTTYVSKSTKLNKKAKKLYVDAMVANMLGLEGWPAPKTAWSWLYSCKSWPSTTEMDENCMNSSRFLRFGFDSVTGPEEVPEALMGSSWSLAGGELGPVQLCSTKMAGKKRTKASKPVEALIQLEQKKCALENENEKFIMGVVGLT